ncbi:uncharacterized protein LOC143807809 [Ranitomeya variabilis]|uniref:uncharacterized protein LOC143807809 n=1 Tax=Ranitomeya variabilis TaxID=490064 RepID=UPI0040578E65
MAAVKLDTPAAEVRAAGGDRERGVEKQNQRLIRRIWEEIESLGKALTAVLGTSGLSQDNMRKPPERVKGEVRSMKAVSVVAPECNSVSWGEEQPQMTDVPYRGRRYRLKRPPDRRRRECWTCRKMGHMSRNCPTREERWQRSAHPSEGPANWKERRPWREWYGWKRRVPPRTRQHRNMLRPCRSQPDSSPVIPREMDITNTVGDTDTGDVEVEDIPTPARLTDTSDTLTSSTDLPTGAESGVTDRGERLAPVRRTARTTAGVPPGQSYRDQYVWPSSQPGPTTSTAIAALETVVDRDCQPSSGGACNELAGSDCSVIIDIEESVTDTAPVWPEVIPTPNVITEKQTVLAKLPPVMSCDQEGGREEEEPGKSVCAERSLCMLVPSCECDITDCLDDPSPLKADFQILNPRTVSGSSVERPNIHSAVTSPQILNPGTVSGSSVERPNIPPLPAVPQGLQSGPERRSFV